jgi:hypothetical protein
MSQHIKLHCNYSSKNLLFLSRQTLGRHQILAAAQTAPFKLVMQIDGEANWAATAFLANKERIKPIVIRASSKPAVVAVSSNAEDGRGKSWWWQGFAPCVVTGFLSCGPRICWNYFKGVQVFCNRRLLKVVVAIALWDWFGRTSTKLNISMSFPNRLCLSRLLPGAIPFPRTQLNLSPAYTSSSLTHRHLARMH